jgi:hypothetical protein
MTTTKEVQEFTLFAVALGMLASVLFGFIDALAYLVIEDPLTDLWKKYNLYNEETTPIINSGISSAIAILLAVFIERYIEANFHVFKHPFVHATGIIVGTILLLVGYKIYNDIRQPLVYHLAGNTVLKPIGKHK